MENMLRDVQLQSFDILVEGDRSWIRSCRRGRAVRRRRVEIHIHQNVFFRQAG